MRILLAVFIVCCVVSSKAQDKFSDRVYFGGGFGLSAGSNGTNISLSPQVGYKVTERYSVGFGITYQYVKFQNINSSINNYGWSIFNRYNLTRQFFGYAEFENLQFEFFTSTTFDQTRRKGYNSLLVGAGYSESLSKRASFSITVLYNVLYDARDAIQPYDSPLVVRAGIGIGIF